MVMVNVMLRTGIRSSNNVLSASSGVRFYTCILYVLTTGTTSKITGPVVLQSVCTWKLTKQINSNAEFNEWGVTISIFYFYLTTDNDL